MGVRNVLKKATFEAVGEYNVLDALRRSGKRSLGVDMYVVLHWAFSRYPDYHQQLVLDPDCNCEKVYEDVVQFVEYLVEKGFTLILVYDGLKLDYKISEEDREKRRERAVQMQQWQYAYDVTPVQAKRVYDLLASKMTQIVAPYEADSQLAYLYFNGSVDCVLTSDTDLIFYGVEDIIFFICGSFKLYRGLEMTEDLMDKNTRLNSLSLVRKWILPLLIGNDFTRGIRGYGIEKSMSVATTISLPSEQLSKEEYLREIVDRVYAMITIRNQTKEELLMEFKKIVQIYTTAPAWTTDTQLIQLDQGREVYIPTEQCVYENMCNKWYKDVENLLNRSLTKEEKEEVSKKYAKNEVNSLTLKSY